MSTSDEPTLAVTLESVHLYPIKSCAGIAPKEALLIETGFDLDRAWMVVDTAGELVTQRELPRMALIRPTLKGDELVLRAPGMLALHLALDRVEAPCKATVWNDTVAAYDMGALAAQWFSDFLGQPLRLARFDPEQKRIADRRWTGEIEAETSFQDGFPLLVTSTAGLAEVNRRLVDEVVTVTDDEIVDAMVFLFDRLKLVTEPSGAVGVAALLSGKLDARGAQVGVVLSGGNVGAARFAELVSRPAATRSG